MSELVVVVVVVIHLTLLNYVHNVNCQFARYLNALWMTTNDINSINSKWHCCKQDIFF